MDRPCRRARWILEAPDSLMRRTLIFVSSEEAAHQDVVQWAPFSPSSHFYFS